MEPRAKACFISPVLASLIFDLILPEESSAATCGASFDFTGGAVSQDLCCGKRRHL